MFLWDSLTGVPIASLMQGLALALGCMIAFSRSRSTRVIGNAPLFSWLMLGWPLLDLSHLLANEHQALAGGRCGVDALMALACIAISGTTTLECRIPLLGIASGLVISCNMGIQALGGSPDALTGNANHTLAVCVPGLIGWVLQTTRLKNRSALIPSSLLILSVAWCWLAYVGIWRRGALLALALGIAAGFLADLRIRRPTLADTLIFFGLSVLVAWACWQVSAGISLDRNIRVLYWQSAWDGIRTWWPWGAGPWSAMHLPILNSDSSRILLILGEPIDHVHNEPLSILLEYGLPGLLLASLQTIALVRDLRIFTNPDLLIPRIGALASLCIFLLVDNAFSMPFGRISLGVITGMLLSGKDVGAYTPSVKGLTLFRSAGLPFLALGFIPFMMEVPVWLTPVRSGASRLLPAVESTGIPQVAGQLLELAAQNPMPNMGGLGDPLTRSALDRFGPGDPFLDHRLQSIRFLGRTSLILAAKASGDAQAKSLSNVWQQEHPKVLDEWSVIAIQAIHFWPMRMSAYEDVAQLLAAKQQFSISGRLLARTRRLQGDPEMDPPRLDINPDKLEDAADLWAECRWWILCQKSPTPELHLSLQRLAQRWGWAISDPLPFLATLDADTEHARGWMIMELDSLGRICLNADFPRLESSLNRITHPSAARVLQPILVRISGKLTHDESGKFSTESLRKLWSSLDRVHGLARMPEGTPHPP